MSTLHKCPPIETPHTNPRLVAEKAINEYQHRCRCRYSFKFHVVFMVFIDTPDEFGNHIENKVLGIDHVVILASVEHLKDALHTKQRNLQV